MKKIILTAIIIMLTSANLTNAQTFTSQQKSAMCKKIKSACRYAWNGYKKYAWGYDALKPLTNQGENWYGTSLLMTPLDAYDTFVLMGLKDESKESKDIILSKLNFDINEEVQFFEITIRMLGGLLSAYELDGDKRFLDLAEDLGRRMMPVFNSPTGMPYRFVHLQAGNTRDSISNPAEIGTCLLEFGKLSQYTKDSSYYNAAKKGAFEVYKRRSPLDMIGTVIDVNTGEWKNTESHVSARIDSYYEYLFKAWILLKDADCRDAWEVLNNSVKKYMLQETPHGSFFTRVDMNSGKETRSYYGALDAFYAGLLAYSGDVATAQEVQKGNFYMWTLFNMEPERFNFRNDTIVYAGYPLRPENIESCFYLYRKTHDNKYLYMGKRMINDILDKCRTKSGYASVRNVKTLELDDSMESFFFAETLKYAYLLFAPEETLSLKEFVFNTEAHPMRIK